MVIETPHVLAPCGLMLREGQYIVTEDGVVCSNGGGGEIVPATADILGGIKVGGSFNITSDGVLTTKLPAPPASPDPTKEYVMKNGEWVESSTAEISPATTTTLGGIKVGDSFEMDANDKLKLKAPTASTLGGVKAGASGNIVIDSNGNISTKIPEAPTNDGKQYIMKGTVDGNGEWVEFVVPVATDTTAGGVIVGDGLSVGADGTISTTIQEAPTDGKQYVRKGAGWNEFAYDPATATTLGGVSIKANGGIKNESGEISVDKATATTLGGVSVPADSGLDLGTNGALTLAEATDTTLGGIMVDGDGLEVDTDGKIGVNVGTGLAIDDATGELYVDKTVNALGLTWDGGVTATIVAPSTTAEIEKYFDEFVAGKKPLGFGIGVAPNETLTGIIVSEENQSGIKVFKSYVEYQGKQYVFTFKRNTATVTVQQVKDVFSFTISEYEFRYNPSCSIPELNNAISANKAIVGYYNPTNAGADPIHRAFVFNSWHQEGDTRWYEFYARDLEKLYKYQLQATPITGGSYDVVGNITEISSGGGSDTLIANFDGTVIPPTCDKTLSEVYNAIHSGTDVRATYNEGFHCYVENASTTSVKFVGIINVEWNDITGEITQIRYAECELKDDHGTQAVLTREHEVAVGGGGVEEPTADGTFVRKAKTESGTTTYSWEDVSKDNGNFVIPIGYDYPEKTELDYKKGYLDGVTWDEIIEAYNDGKTLVADYEGNRLNLTQLNINGTTHEPSLLRFTGIEQMDSDPNEGILKDVDFYSVLINKLGSVVVTIDYGSINDYEPPADGKVYGKSRSDETSHAGWTEVSGGGESDVFWVNINDDGTLSATGAEMKTAFLAGKLVILKDYTGMYPESQYILVSTRMPNHLQFTALTAYLGGNDLDARDRENGACAVEMLIPTNFSATDNIWDLDRRLTYAWKIPYDINGRSDTAPTEGTYVRKYEDLTYSWEKVDILTEARVQEMINAAIIETMSTGY